MLRKSIQLLRSSEICPLLYFSTQILQNTLEVQWNLNKGYKGKSGNLKEFPKFECPIHQNEHISELKRSWMDFRSM